MYMHTHRHIQTYFLSELISLLSHPKLHSKSSCDHFKNYFLLLNFANNLLSILADVSVFKPLGTWLNLFSFPMLKIKEMTQMWPNTLEKIFPTHTPQSPYSCDPTILSRIFSSIRDVSNYDLLCCQGWHHSDVVWVFLFFWVFFCFVFFLRKCYWFLVTWGPICNNLSQLVC